MSVSSNDEVNKREVVEWIVSDQKLEWVNDAIEHYELLNSFTDDSDTIIGGDEVEREIIRKWSK